MARVLIASLSALLSLVVLLPAFVVSGAQFLFAACVRGIARVLEPSFVPWNELMMFDPKLGWRPRPNLDAHYLAQRDDIFHVATDAEGWAGSRSLDESSVLVIGDSFAFGYGVDTGRSFANLNPTLSIKSIGSPGYSMVQGVLLMEQFGARMSGKLVVWFVCQENDLEDNLAPGMMGYRAPFIRPAAVPGGWEIVDSHVTPTVWRGSAVGATWTRAAATRLLPNICVPGALSDRVFAGCDYLIGRASTACARAGARLVLVTVPDPTQLTAAGHADLAARSAQPDACDPHLPDRRLAEICARHQVPCVAGKDHLTAADYKHIEGLHWNQRGHRRISEMLGQLYASFKSGAFAERQSRSHAAVGGALSMPAPVLHESRVASR